jgi:DNA-binding NarL/FixJ family response regulator
MRRSALRRRPQAGSAEEFGRQRCNGKLQQTVWLVDKPEVDEVKVSALLVEDNPTDMLLMQEALSEVPGVRFVIQEAGCLSEALARLENDRFDVAVVDLGLPDCSGLETLQALHEKAPDIPKVVMTGVGDEQAGIQAMQMGAQDYVVKSDIHATLLPRVVRYAVERHRLQKALQEARDRRTYERERRSMERLSKPPENAFTEEIYNGSPLRQSAPQGFLEAVEQCEAILEQALERRIYKAKDTVSEQLREMSCALAFLRAGPRDVIEVYSNALNNKVRDRPLEATQLYMDEGRVTVLELMGYLVSHYRHYCPEPTRKGP